MKKTLAFTKSLYYNLDIFALKKDTGDFLEHYFTNNENLRSELRTIKYEVKGVPFSFLSDNGVFSKDEIDYGSIVLVNSILKNTNNDNLNILDPIPITNPSFLYSSALDVVACAKPVIGTNSPAPAFATNVSKNPSAVNKQEKNISVTIIRLIASL